MSFYLNETDPAKQFKPTKELLLDYCFTKSPAHANRFILVAKHDWAHLPDGEQACLRCGRLRKDIEDALEIREKGRNIKEL
jgi:hypothetical protein